MIANRPPACDGCYCEDCGLFGCTYPVETPDPMPAQSEKQARNAPEMEKRSA